jgi:hypothetical protein
MTTKPAPTAPDWLVPGAKVLIQTFGNHTEHIKISSVNKIAAQSFTVDGFPHRFKIATQIYNAPGTWGGHSRVIPVDSDEARKLIGIARKSRLDRIARNACDNWIRLRTHEARVAAITALLAVED